MGRGGQGPAIERLECPSGAAVQYNSTTINNDGMNMLGPTLDRSVSAFLEDVQQRGLSERILLVIVGDFGRSPKLGKGAGRGHWAKLCPLLFAGGGLRMGQVIGASNEKAEVPASDPISPADMMATVMHTLFDAGKLRLDASAPRNISQQIERGRRIEEFFESQRPSRLV